MSTESEPFSLVLICLGTTKFVLLSVFTLKETICPKICSKSRLKSAKNLLPVDVRRSKTSLLKVLPKMVTENGIYSPPMKVISNTILFIFCAAPSSKLPACVTCDGAIISKEPTPFLASKGFVTRFCLTPVGQERVTRTSAWEATPCLEQVRRYPVAFS